MSKYHTKSHGPDAPAFSRGFAKLVELSAATGNVGYLVLHSKENLDNMSGYLPDKVIKELQKTGVARVGGFSLRLATSRNPPRDLRGPALIPFAALDDVEKIGTSPFVTDTLFLPWMETELNSYVAMNRDSIEI